MIQEPDESWLWRLYAAALESDSPAYWAQALESTEQALESTLDSWPALRVALAAAKSKRNLGVLGEFVDPETRQAWEVLRDTQNVDAQQQALIALGTKGDLGKQRMFVHAMAETHFDVPRVCKLLGISKRTLDGWAVKYPEFATMLDGIRWAKANFVEAQLMKLVATGDTKAVIHANEGLNRETYGKSMRVEGQVDHRHLVGVIDLEAINLPLETKVGLLRAIRDAGLLDSDALLLGHEKTPGVPEW